MEMPMYWNDSRIVLNTTVMDTLSPGRWYYIDPDWKSDIWFPTVIIQNMQEFKTLKSVKTNEKFMITRNKVSELEKK